MPDAASPLAPEDELAIRNLLSRLAFLADTAPLDDLDEYIDCFTDDAVWESPQEVRRGRAEVLSGARERRQAGVQGPGTNSRHVLGTTSVRAEGPEEASADSYFMAFGDTTTQPTVRVMGHYHDTFRRTGGRWRVAHRQVTFG